MLPTERELSLMAAVVSAMPRGARPRIDGRYLTAEELDRAEALLEDSDALMDEIEAAEAAANDVGTEAA